MTDLTQQPALQREAQFGDYFELLKPRVMSLVVFTAPGGPLVAPGPVHPFHRLRGASCCIAVGGGASGALNMSVDRGYRLR